MKYAIATLKKKEKGLKNIEIKSESVIEEYLDESVNPMFKEQSLFYQRKKRSFKINCNLKCLQLTILTLSKIS